MKYLINFLLLVLLLPMGCGARTTKEEPGDAFVLPRGAMPMTIRNDHVFVEVIVNDSIPAQMWFDTGNGGSFVFWEEFAIRHGMKYSTKVLDAWCGDTAVLHATNIQSPTTIRLGDVALGHTHLLVEMPHYPDVDGVFSPDFQTDKRIWELNFEHDYMQIHDRDTVPPHSLRFPLTYDETAGIHPVIDIPLALIGKDNDTLRLNGPYDLDTGTAATIGFFRQENPLVSFVSRQPSAEHEFVTKGVLCGDVAIPYGRFFFWQGAEGSFPNIMGTLGTTFLKYFNVFIDLEHSLIYLQKHDRKYENNHYPDLGCYLVRKGGKLHVGGRIFEDSPAYKAGLRGGEEIVEINGMQSDLIDDESIEKLHRSPEGTVVRLVIMGEDGLKTVTINAYRNPLNLYN